jgi:hypothetical protein
MTRHPQIYRCYVIWDSSKRKVIGLPVLLALGTAGLRAIILVDQNL